jgi:CMP-N-acetylneuraminic acid synthetase
MFKNFTILGVIPARSGSKGLPNKNIMMCAGKPLIQWTIESALKVDYLDNVIVTTDSQDIAMLAETCGAKVPFIRPFEISQDSSSIIDVIDHASKNYLDCNGNSFDYIVLLQPTSPLRGAVHIKEALEYFFNKKLSDNDSLISAYKISPKYGWLMRYNDNNDYVNFCLSSNNLNPQRQKLDEYVLPNGAICIINARKVNRGIYSGNTLCYLMSTEESIDIDTQDDFCAAEKALLRKVI